MKNFVFVFLGLCTFFNYAQAQCSPTVYWTRMYTEDYSGQFIDGRFYYKLQLKNNCNMTVTVRLKHYGGDSGTDLVCHTYTLSPGEEHEKVCSVQRITDAKFWYKFKGDSKTLPDCDINY